MTKAVLLEQLRLFTAEATKDLLLPVALQKEDQEQPRPREGANPLWLRR